MSPYLCPRGIVATLYFFFQAEDGIRAGHVTGVQTCALPISHRVGPPAAHTPNPTATGSATATALVVPLRSAANTPRITIAATETIGALEDLLPKSRPTAQRPPEELLTLAHLTCEDRSLATAID